MATGSDLLAHRITRIAPHVVDTLFLITGVWLVFHIAFAKLAFAGDASTQQVNHDVVDNCQTQSSATLVAP